MKEPNPKIPQSKERAKQIIYFPKIWFNNVINYTLISIQKIIQMYYSFV